VVDARLEKDIEALAPDPNEVQPADDERT
jgi:hypothetical protein